VIIYAYGATKVGKRSTVVIPIAIRRSYGFEEGSLVTMEAQSVLEADPSIECPIDLPEKDQPVLVAAISAKADYLLTGDIEHFGKYFGQRIMDVRICMARDYLLQYLDS
jgi:bifunctional DNA-binding transcriptional regulator/antitoxin component of YhaV-PrlF toxin-antitoxin module